MFPSMFKKKRTFPPGTFLPTPLRCLAIMQLCLAFTVTLSILCQPYLGDLFELKREKNLFEAVFSQKHLFTELSQAEQLSIQAKYEALLEKGHASFIDKGKKGIIYLFIETSPFKKAWILFSIVLSVMLLKKQDNAIAACWLLPFSVLAFAAENAQLPSKISREERLFPTEAYLLEHYVNAPLSSGIGAQKDQLTDAWEKYLIQEWALKTPSTIYSVYEQQKIEGFFQFSVARIASLEKSSAKEKTSFMALLAYMGWNLFFAGYVTLHRNVFFSFSQRPNEGLSA